MPPRTRPSSSSTAQAQSWRTVEPAPVMMLYGKDEYFASRAKQRLRSIFDNLHEETEITTLSAKDYRLGELTVATSPSLFSSAKIIDINQLSLMSQDFLKDSLHYLKNPDSASLVIMHHTGGNRGKKLLEAFKVSRQFPLIECNPLKNDREKLGFVQHEFGEYGQKIDPAAAQLLVAAAGSDTAELAAACLQLVQDVAGVVTEETVNKYYGGRSEVTAFKVADAAVAGNSRAALKLLRHALNTGVEPIALVGVLAARMRTIAKVHGSGDSAGSLAGSLSMAPWQVEQAQRDSRRFSQEDLVLILTTLAEVDAQLKGETQGSPYTVEKVVLTIASA